MPAPVMRIMSYLSNPDSDMNTLASLIEYDPGLTANVLRMANSSLFGLLDPVTTTRDALFKLGTRRVMQLVIASGVAPSAAGEVKGYGLAEGEFLRFSISIGLGAELAAQLAGIAAPAHTFTAGLLCPIGKMVLGRFLGVDAGPILDLAVTEDLSFEQAERRILGIDHAELGALLLASWGLPEPIVTCVRWHLNPCLAPKPDTARDLAHVGLALTTMAGIGLGVDGMRYQACQDSFDRLGVTPEHVNEALEKLVDNLTEIEEILSQV
jgi:HD-like signal output (HDOD) protein